MAGCQTPEENAREEMRWANEAAMRKQAQQFGSQYRETLAESGYELLGFEDAKATAILRDPDSGEEALWYRNDQHAGYTIEIQGVGYEYGMDRPYTED
jgi:hypothetical protein